MRPKVVVGGAAIALLLLLLALVPSPAPEPARAQTSGPLDCGPDKEIVVGGIVQLTCSRSDNSYLLSAQVDWGDGTGQPCPVIPPLSGNVTCPSHAYAQSGGYTARVSADSLCPPGLICLCDFKPDLCGPCSNQAGGEYCDDVLVTVTVGVGGIAELPEVASSQQVDTMPSDQHSAIAAAVGLAVALAFVSFVGLYVHRRLR